MIRLNLRTRVELFKGSDRWIATTVPCAVPASAAALLLCDVWDAHWCRSAMRRCDLLARKIAPVVDAMRARGVQIMHAPSDCMEFYRDAPQRRRMLDVPRVEPPPRDLPEPPLPIDDSDGGCDDLPPCSPASPWTRQHPAIGVGENDAISEDGLEVYSLLRRQGIEYLLIAGVHTNMCVLKRSFTIRQMARWGMRCILVRDLTDSMYNPRMHPFVPHDRGTALVIEHIERWWCPTVTSDDLK